MSLTWISHQVTPNRITHQLSLTGIKPQFSLKGIAPQFSLTGIKTPIINDCKTRHFSLTGIAYQFVMTMIPHQLSLTGSAHQVSLNGKTQHLLVSALIDRDNTTDHTDKDKITVPMTGKTNKVSQTGITKNLNDEEKNLGFHLLGYQSTDP